MFIRNVFIAFIISLLWLSCSEQKESPKDIFRYNESKGIGTLDPAFAKSQTIIWPVNQLFNGLVQMNEHTEIEACIAKTWEISENGKTYTFHLRDDVFFHEDTLFKGKRKVIASDFVYSLKRLSDSKTASPGAWVMNYLNKDTLDNGFSALNDSTLVIQLKQAFPGFLGILSMAYCSVVPKEIVQYYGKAFRNHPIGTGPFYLKKWREGEKLVLRKNQSYFEKDETGKAYPYLEAISIRFISDKQSEFLEFRKGNIDFISGVHVSYKDELLSRSGELRAKYRKQIKLLKSPYLNTEYLGFSVQSKNSPVHLSYLRKAINWGFDRKKMLHYLRNNIGQAAEQGFIPKGLPSFLETTKGFTYNKDSALYYLKLAGFPNGKGLGEITLTTTSDYVDLCEYIQHELSEIGIKIVIDISSGATFRDQVASSKLDFFRGSWIADYPDAENYLSLFYSHNFSPNGPNYTHFENASYDSLYEQALLETNDSLRRILYREMDRILISEAPIVPLFYDEVIRFSQNNIRNFETNAMNMLFLKKVYKE